MAEIKIAKSMADHLHKLLNPTTYDQREFNSDPRTKRMVKLSSEQLEWARLSTTTAELALSRARATGRDFRAVLAETELRVSVELARILAPTVDPVLRGLREVAAVEGGGVVCGVCQEEVVVGEEVRAMDCTHMFHRDCIFRWLKLNNVCPLCRYHHMD